MFSDMPRQPSDVGFYVLGFFVLFIQHLLEMDLVWFKGWKALMFFFLLLKSDEKIGKKEKGKKEVR